jgi:sugar transferase EpsL
MRKDRVCGSKRWVDLALTVPVLLAVCPVLLLIALVVRWRLGRPVLFRQQRAGLHCVPFQLLKFRSMTNARDFSGRLLPDAERLTPLGRFLRRTSLDELPQLVNVLRGEMSLVGPRPLLVEYVGRYSPPELSRHSVLPGITGWAQVHGRNALSWERRFALDLWYVEHQSLLLDLRILLMTVCSMLSWSDIKQEGCAAMPEFRSAQR